MYCILKSCKEGRSYVKCSYIIIIGEKTLGGDKYVYGLDGGDGFMGVELSPNASGCDIKYVQLFTSTVLQ